MVSRFRMLITAARSSWSEMGPLDMIIDVLLESKGVLQTEEIEGFELSDEQKAERDAALADLTRRVFEPVKRIGN